MDTSHKRITPEAFELVRLELDALEERLVRLRKLLRQAEETPVRTPDPRFRGTDSVAGYTRARAIAAQMSLAGTPRAAAELRLSGLVAPAEVDDILDAAYLPDD